MTSVTSSEDRFPTTQLDQLEGTCLLSDSGQTAKWLLDTLWQCCAEFREDLGSGSVYEVSSFVD